jgi:hypothetical protein
MLDEPGRAARAERAEQMPSPPACSNYLEQFLLLCPNLKAVKIHS